MTIRVATWNMQTAFSPVAQEEKWAFLHDVIKPDIALLTEARALAGVPYTLIHREGGIGKHRPWGSIVAVRNGLAAAEVQFVGHHDLYATWPGATVVADITRNGERLVTVVCMYAPVYGPDGTKVNHGRHMTRAIAQDLLPLFNSRGRDRIILGGDLNHFPDETGETLGELPLLMVEHGTSSDACPCHAPKPCGHMWTHRNKSQPDRFQQVDYLFVTPALAPLVASVCGGAEDFPEAWNVSDHAPIVAEFDRDGQLRTGSQLSGFQRLLMNVADRIDPAGATGP